MTIYETITAILAALLVPLIVLFVNHVLEKDREKTRRFQSSADEIRRSFDVMQVKIRSGGIMYDYALYEFIEVQELAMADFRRHLRRADRTPFNKACEQYCDYCHSHSRAMIMGHMRLGEFYKLIEDVLRFVK